jgi:predicted hydrocarbon binding protein
VNDQFIGEAQLTGTFESLAWHNQSTQIRCYWLRGFLRGVISELEGRPYGVEEVACQAKGDPACRFDFRPQGT